MSEQRLRRPRALRQRRTRCCDAIPAVQARRGLGRLEAYTPYPVHGLDEALGLRRSPLGGMVLVMGILGAADGPRLPVVDRAPSTTRSSTGGKALFSWEAFVPDHVRGDGALRHLHRRPRHAAPAEPAALLRPPGARARRRSRRSRATGSRWPSRPDAGRARRRGRPGGARARPAQPRSRSLPDVEPPPVPDQRLRPADARRHRRRLRRGGLRDVLGRQALPGPAADGPHAGPAASSMPQQAERLLHGRPRHAAARRRARWRAATCPTASATQEEAAALANPLPRTAEVLASGPQGLRDTDCAVCHGPLGERHADADRAPTAPSRPTCRRSRSATTRTGKLYDVDRARARTPCRPTPPT